MMKYSYLALISLIGLAAVVADTHITPTNLIDDPVNQKTVLLPEEPGLYTIGVKVTDGCATYTDTIMYDIQCAHPPVAQAGESRSYQKSCGEDLAVFVDGGLSDSTSDTLGYKWSFDRMPDASRLTDDDILDSQNTRASFVPDALGSYVLRLSVRDCCGTSSDTVEILFECNDPPQAFAGKDEVVHRGEEIHLDGSASADGNGDKLAYKWDFIVTPGDSVLSADDIRNPDTAFPAFTPDVRGNFVLRLTVEDCCSSSSDEVVVVSSCNDAPTANAGDDESVTGLQTVVLDASGSTDPDKGDDLVYTWKFIAVPTLSTLTTADLIGYDVVNAKFDPDQLGVYDIELAVSDCCSTSRSRKRVTVGCNQPPEANAGDEKHVVINEPYLKVDLDGCSSSDPDSDKLTYTWSFTFKPATSVISNDDIEIQGEDGCLASFVPDGLGTYELKLQVTDHCTVDEDLVKIIVGCNKFPRAMAGPDQTVAYRCEPTVLNLNGAESSDPDNAVIYYKWEFVTLPENSKLTSSAIAHANEMYASFQPDVLGIYDIQLTVTDGCTHDVDTIRVFHVCNDKPTAKAGPDRLLVGEFPWTDRVVLDGSKSTDPDGDILEHYWTLISRPDSSSLSPSSIVNNRDATAHFVPDAPGRYEVEMSVSDCCSNDTDVVVITVSCGDLPTANAGPDRYMVQQCTNTTQTFQLNGTLSHDPDNHHLEFQWSFVSVPKGSKVIDSDIHGANSPLAWFTLDESDRVTHSDEYVLQLSVTDSCNTVTDQMRITYCCNNPPSAHAGLDITFPAAPPFPPVFVDGGGSNDPDGDSLSYTWAITRVPPRSSITTERLTIHSEARTAFSPDVRGVYELEVTVADCCTSSSDKVKVTVTCDKPPVADAGNDQLQEHFCSKETSIVLDGSRSYDPDQSLSTLTFEWTFASIPADSTLTDASILSPLSAVASFSPDATGEYVISLTASDGCSEVSDTVKVEYTCTGSPIAVAGEDFEIVSNPPFPAVHVSGKDSEDPGGEILSYEWSFVKLPLGSALGDMYISNYAPLLLGATFTPDAPGCYILELAVEGCCAKDKDQVRVCVTCNEAPVAYAGNDQHLTKGAERPVVVVNGCDSSDPNGDPIVYHWKFLRVPPQSVITNDEILGRTNCEARFSPDVTGEFQLQLTVYDSCNTASDTVKIRYRCNKTPIVNAGEDRFIARKCGNANNLIELIGSGSSDPDGDPLDYHWTFDSLPETSHLTNSSIRDATREIAYFKPDVLGIYVAQLTISDYCFTLHDRVRVGFKCNKPPSADAGQDQEITANPFPMINLHGSYSYDEDEDELTFHWRFVSSPDDSKLMDENIVDSNKASAYFMPDVNGVYLMELTVSDCCSSVSDDVKVTVLKKSCNDRPVANAGENNVFYRMCGDCATGECSSVSLDGSGSHDSDEDPLTYKWKFISKPELSTLRESDGLDFGAARAQFTPDVVGLYRMQLTVSDGCNVDADEVVIDYRCNDHPTADAGEDQTIQSEGLAKLPKVTVNARRSHDVEGDRLTYSWDFVDKAKGSCMTNKKLDCFGPVCSFEPDLRGCYELEVTVSDCCSSDKDTTRVCITCSSDISAYAGQDETVMACPPFPQVFLQGNATNVQDEGNLQYEWSFQTLPAASLLEDGDIRNGRSNAAFFMPDVNGIYEILFTIVDGCSFSSDVKTVYVGCNSSPNADAGADQSVRYNGRRFPKVFLDGTLSSDDDQDDINFNWKFVKTPAESKLRDEDINNNDMPVAAFWPDTTGVFEVILTVTDCCTPDMDTVVITVGCNSVPSVDAGESQYIVKTCRDTTVFLQGLAQDPDMDELTYEWRFTSMPPQSKLTDRKIESANSPRASFMPDMTGSFFELTLFVSDGCSTVTDRVKIDYECSDPPHAHAGPDQVLYKECAQSVIYLDGSATSDPENDVLSYDWVFRTVPPTSQVGDKDIINPNTAHPYFHPDETGIYEVQLTVDDCCGLRCTCMKDRVLITYMCKGEPPIASAGDDFLAKWDYYNPLTVELDGSTTMDPDEDVLSFEWTFTLQPHDSKLTDKDITNRESNRPYFVPDVNGEYELEMTVSDCCFSEKDRVHVSVSCDNPPVTIAGSDQSLEKTCNECHTGNGPQPRTCKEISVPVFLDGSSSYDPDNEKLNCTWNFVCTPLASALTVDDIQNRHTPVAFFSADALGEYVMEITCSDGCSSVKDELIVDVACNRAPHAVASTVDFTMDCDNQEVIVDASDSFDAEQDPLWFAWSFVNVPQGSQLDDSHLRGADVRATAFTPDECGTYTLSVRVSDCCSHDETVTSVNVECSLPPTVTAEDDKTAFWDGVEDFVATVSATVDDRDSKARTYDWSFTTIPEGSMLLDEDIEGGEEASFRPDQYGTYGLRVEASDCCSSVSDYVYLTVQCNNVTHVTAGSDQLFRMGCGAEYPLEVDFDGVPNVDVRYEWELLKFNSYDVKKVDAGCEYEGVARRTVVLDQGSITHSNTPAMVHWQVTRRPECSDLSDKDIRRHRGIVASFVPDCEGTFEFVVTVIDELGSSTDTAVVRVTSLGGHGLLETLQEVTGTTDASSTEKLMIGVLACVSTVMLVAIATIVIVYRKRTPHLFSRNRSSSDSVHIMSS